MCGVLVCVLLCVYDLRGVCVAVSVRMMCVAVRVCMVSVWGSAVGPEGGLAAWTPSLGRGSENAAKGRRAVAWAELWLGRGSGNQAGSLGWGWGLRAGGWAR